MAAQTVTDKKPLFSENWRNLQQILAQEKKQKEAASSKDKNISGNGEKNGRVTVVNRRKRKHDSAVNETNMSKNNDNNNIWKKRRMEIQEMKTAKETTEEKNAEVTKILGLDCEYVGAGIDGNDNVLARVSIVNEDGVPVYDKYVKPSQRVTDFRTAVSGIRPHNLINGVPLKQIQSEVSKLIAGRIVVGHALHNDFKVLNIPHPRKLTRDTFKYPELRQAVNKKFPSLKLLARQVLGVNIQEGEHDSVEDARIALKLYLLYKKKWENVLRKMRK